MNVLDALGSRRTVRQYDPAYAIPRGVLDALADVVLDSPTARNAQELDLVVVASRARLDALAKIAFDSWGPELQEGFRKRAQTHGVANVVTCDAPAVFFFVENERAKGLPRVGIDAGIQSMALMAAARAFGYGTMCLGALLWGNKTGLEAALGIPPGSLAMAVAVGKPRDGPLLLLEKTRLCSARYLE
jgi:nitroreductase